jgi:hypothetical protein
MRLARALELTHNFVSTPDSLKGLDSLLDPFLVEQALDQAGVATLRKRCLPLELMLWCVISMVFFRRMSAWDLVSRVNIMLPGQQRPLVAPSAVVQARQRLGSEASRHVLDLTQKSWYEAAGHPTWAGLRLLESMVSSGERPIHPKTVRVTTPPVISMAMPAFLRYAWSAKWS